MNGETVTVRTPVAGADDPYGQPTVTWTALDVEHVAVAPTTGAEGTDAFRQMTDAELTVYLPTGTAITSRSRVVVRGEEFEVVGEPGDWRSPFTDWRPGIVANLKRSEG